jgi:hypothetical protein
VVAVLTYDYGETSAPPLNALTIYRVVKLLCGNRPYRSVRVCVFRIKYAKWQNNWPIYLQDVNIVISGFRRDVDELSALQVYYVASSDNAFPTFRDDVSVTSSRVKKSRKKRR